MAESPHSASGYRAWVISGLWILAPLLVGAVSGLVTASAASTWYTTLVKPPWTPPSYVFAPVWTLLYILMGIAAALVWRAKREGCGFALTIFSVHLAVNALWSVVFFGLHSPGWALLVIGVLWGMIFWLVYLFWAQSRTASWLLMPYLLWVTYAATLNAGIVLLTVWVTWASIL